MRNYFFFPKQKQVYLYPAFHPPIPSVYLAAIHSHPVTLKHHQSGLKSQQHTCNWTQKTEALLKGHIQGVHILLPLCQWAVLLSSYLSEWQPQIQRCYSYMNYIGRSSRSIQEARRDAKIYYAHKCTAAPQRKKIVKLASVEPQKYML